MKTILIVDDEYAFAETLGELLREEGYRVVSAGNGRDGLANVQTEKPDLVLTDLVMPFADGRELVRAMRALQDSRLTPVVMMSASIKATAVSDAGGGMVDVATFLQKPFTWETLLDVVVGLIGKADDAER